MVEIQTTTISDEAKLTKLTTTPVVCTTLLVSVTLNLYMCVVVVLSLLHHHHWCSNPSIPKTNKHLYTQSLHSSTDSLHSSTTTTLSKQIPPDPSTTTFFCPSLSALSINPSWKEDWYDPHVTAKIADIRRAHRRQHHLHYSLNPAATTDADADADAADQLVHQKNQNSPQSPTEGIKGGGGTTGITAAQQNKKGPPPKTNHTTHLNPTITHDDDDDDDVLDQPPPVVGTKLITIQHALSNVVVSAFLSSPTTTSTTSQVVKKSSSREIIPQLSCRHIPNLLDGRGGGIGVLLGVGDGEFAKLFLTQWTDTAGLYLVDPYIHIWKGYQDPANVSDQAHQLAYKILREHLTLYFPDKFVFIRDFSHSFIHTLKETGSTPLSLVWIDANHSLKSVKRDIEDWAPLLAEGGIIGGTAFKSDSQESIRVEDAVVEFAVQRGLKVYVTESSDYEKAVSRSAPCWFIVA